MKNSHESNKGMIFIEPLACELDNQVSADKFIKLFEFMIKFNYKALNEWCKTRNFPISAPRAIASTLKDLGTLN
jgi:hypothetical protein